MLANHSYYGGYRTRTFSDIYPEVNEFITDYNTLYNGTMSEEDLTRAYYLLCSRYMNSHIANTDENQFKMKLVSYVFQYGPTWARRLEIQSTLRNMSEDDLILGSKTIYNHANNPSTIPSTSSLEELLEIDAQNTQTFKKSKLEAYNLLWNMLVADVTGEFLGRFKNLFIIVVQPDYPLVYVDEADEEEDEEA